MFRTLSFILLIVFCSCGSRPYPTNVEKKDPELPEYSACNETPEILDSEIPLRRMGKYSPLSYAYTYNSINIAGDSLEKEKIRRSNARLSEIVVKEVFPGIEVVDGSSIGGKTYEEVHVAESRIYSLLTYQTSGRNSWTDLSTGKTEYRKPPKSTIAAAAEAMKVLSVPSKSNLQLFVIVRSYIQRNRFKNSVHVYIFDKLNFEVDYYDRLEYQCDIRDREAFVQVMEYALKTINSNQN